VLFLRQFANIFQQPQFEEIFLPYSRPTLNAATDKHFQTDKIFISSYCKLLYSKDFYTARIFSIKFYALFICPADEQGSVSFSGFENPDGFINAPDGSSRYFSPADGKSLKSGFFCLNFNNFTYVGNDKGLKVLNKGV
jgi:hypothetical protein